MNWKMNIQTALHSILNEFDSIELYNDDRHRQLFHEITECYCDKAFFTPGLVKCMYMAAWDDEHFAQLLAQLTEMSFARRSEALSDMAENGQLMAEESVLFSNSTDACLYKLSCSFIEEEPFDLSSVPEDLDERGRQVLDLSLKAAAVIDRIIHNS